MKGYLMGEEFSQKLINFFHNSQNKLDSTHQIENLCHCLKSTSSLIALTGCKTFVQINYVAKGTGKS